MKSRSLRSTGINVVGRKWSILIVKLLPKVMKIRLVGVM